MALVNDDQIKEVRAVVPVENWSAFVPGNGLVGGEVHLAALDRLALNLPAGIPKRSKLLILRVVHEDRTVRQEQNSRTWRR